MTTFLLLLIYIAFIGLGIPDSLFGTAWPAIYQEFHLPISAASCVTLLISGCTVISSLLSTKMINKFGTPVITAVSTVMTAAALLGFSVSPSFIFLCFFAIPLGIEAGAIDSGLNNYVALHYKATHMNFLHCFYGIGVSFSPYLMALTLSDHNWRYGYRLAFFCQLIIAMIIVVTLPIWKKAHTNRSGTENESAAKTLKFSEMLRMPAVRIVWLIFISSCAIEYTCGTWGSTFLVKAKGFSTDTAAAVITFYYIGMALGRFLSGILSVKLSSWNIILMGQGLVFFAILLLLLPLQAFVFTAGLFLIGLGNGPIFPNLIHLTPQNFGRDISQSIMSTQIAASYIGIMFMPPIFGFLGQIFGMHLFPFYLLALFFVMIGSTYFIRKILITSRLK